ncbi:anti-sigma factor domain-containing protein [Streptomyces sp. NPDC059917]|uniref:anti-sigma factor n=1 Tax=Streptomyces sp. NPDC059917 TaxID=3347002 RepID=UPI0036475349
MSTDGTTSDHADGAGPEDPHGAAGAYVLHALDPAERAAFEAHLETCPTCAHEVRELSGTAARLALAVAVPPPPELREAVLRRIRAEGPPVRTPAPGSASAHRRAPGRSTGWTRWALAACLAGAVGLGGLALWQYQRAETAVRAARTERARDADLTGILSAPDARLATGRLAPGGATGTVVLSRERDRAAFVGAGMAAPPAGRVYQLWFADPAGSMRPAGLMDPARPDAPALLAGPVGAATGVGVTLEPAGGSPAPTSPPLMVLAFPAA